MLRRVRALAGAMPVRRLLAPEHRPDLLTFSDDERALASAVRAFALAEVKPLVAQMDKEAKMPTDLLRKLGEQGLLGIEIPQEHGGAGMGFFSSIIAIEELARVDPSVSVLVDVQNTLVVNFFNNFASPALRSKWLPRLAAGEIGAFCLSEASSGSDAFALKARATPSADGSTFTLSGSKMWITNAGEAAVYLVMANAAPEKGYKGITCFVVERGTLGLSLGRREDKLGIRASSTCEVRLDNVVVPREAVLGEVGHGYKYAIQTLNEGRIGIAAQMVGLAQGSLDVAVPYVMERKQFGKTIGSFQAMQHAIGNAGTEIAAARLLTYNAARRKQTGQSFVAEAAMAKLYASQVAQRVSSAAVDWMGGVGFVKGAELAAEKFYRDSKIGTIYEGTSFMQLNLIGKHLTGEK